MLSSLGPERLGIESRLDDPAPATFLGPADTILGDAVSLGHPRRGGRQPPMQCLCRGLEFGRIVTIKALDLVMGSSEVLKRFYRVIGGLGRLWVDCEPTGGSIIQYYCYRVGGKIGIFLTVGRTPVLDEIVASDLVAKFIGWWSSALVGDECRHFLPFWTALHLSLGANVAIGILGEMRHLVRSRHGLRKRPGRLGATDANSLISCVVILRILQKPTLR